MDEYAGRVLADRYRLPLPPQDEYGYEQEPVATRAFDTYSGQEVMIRRLPLPEIVDAEVLDADEPGTRRPDRGPSTPRPDQAVRRPTDPFVRRAVEAAQAAAQIPDHPRLDQVFDVFAEGGSLWIVSELVAARSLASLLDQQPLTPYRAAEIGSEVLTALRALHAHGWTHRNVTAQTVLVCDDGRVVLTGLAAGAAEEALCGYDPLPDQDDQDDQVYEGYEDFADGAEYQGGTDGDDGPIAAEGDEGYDEEAPGSPPEASGGAGGHQRQYAYGYRYGDGGGYDEVDASAAPALPALAPGYEPALPHSHGAEPVPRPGERPDQPPGEPVPPPVVPDARASRAGAIAAYSAGTRAAARAAEARASLSLPPAPEDTGARALPPSGTPPYAAGAGDAEPRWWSHDPALADDEDDDEDEGQDPAYGTRPYGAEGYGDEPYGARPYRQPDEGPGPEQEPPRRAHLAGVWNDGPGGTGRGGTVPAGGGRSPYDRYKPSGSSGQSRSPYGTRDALRADARREQPRLPVPAAAASSRTAAAREPSPDSPHGDGPAGPPRYRGPETPLAAERARQTRIAVVGPVTERWAPEQAGPVHGTWQLAPPVGPSTDLWALGALLYRAVQGHAPYPEENAAELVQMVCSEPPAFAEECGPLRPVVESLLRQDATERPDVEELRGWLRSLVRSAPEPEAGAHLVPMPSVDAGRLPVVRRRGELVRRRRAGRAQAGAHRKARAASRTAAAAPVETTAPLPRPARERRPDKAASGGGSPRSLGRLLLLLVLLLLAAAVAYAVAFMPRAGQTENSGNGQSVAPPTPGPSPSVSASGSATAPGPGGDPAPADPSTDGGQAPSTNTVPPGGGPELADGYAVRDDAEGFRIGVDKSWQRSPINDAGQVRYTGGDFTLIVVPGRDTVQSAGGDPLEYQRTRERELQPWRDSTWATATGLRRVDVGRQATAEGQFTWTDASGREVYVRNLALIVGERYHVVQVIGPESQRDKVSEIYQQAVTAYRSTR
ncbi:protein kinase [Streptomyces sp. NPDC047097]|uniref:protein kinase n=1 Tax=Streptomyces sp. NPDC047097 TaxID=3155260 RepID=UPI0033F33B03